MEEIRTPEESFVQNVIVSNASQTNTSTDAGFGELYIGGPEAPGEPGVLGPPGLVDLKNTLLLAFTYPVALSATILNVTLLIALYRAKARDLKAKNFIQNNAIVNILLPIFASLDAPYIGQLIGGLEPSIIQCLSGFHHRISHSLIMVQSVCVMGLALDRLYATVFPLRYHTVGYGLAIKITMLVFPWFAAALAAIILMAVVDVDKELARPGSGYLVCILLDVSSFIAVAGGFLHGFTISLNLVSFFIYIGIFIRVKYQSLKIKSLNETQKSRRVSLSLSLTYFIMNFTTLALYLPLPLCVIISNANNVRPGFILKVFHLLDTLNSCVDPLLLMNRVRAIRENLPLWKQRESKSRTHKNLTLKQHRFPSTVTSGVPSITLKQHRFPSTVTSGAPSSDPGHAIQ